MSVWGVGARSVCGGLERGVCVGGWSSVWGVGVVCGGLELGVCGGLEECVWGVGGVCVGGWS